MEIVDIWTALICGTIFIICISILADVVVNWENDDEQF